MTLPPEERVELAREVLAELLKERITTSAQRTKIAKYLERGTMVDVLQARAQALDETASTTVRDRAIDFLVDVVEGRA